MRPISTRRAGLLPIVNAQNAVAALPYASITPSASANTKGSYTQLIASTTRETKMIALFLCGNPSGTASKSWLVDIAVGAAASEVVKIPNLCASVAAQFGKWTSVLWIPVNPADFPAGCRIAARCQTQGASGEACFVKATLFDTGFGAQGIDALNTSTSTSLGTAITPGNGSKSSYVQIIASTSRAYKALMLLIDAQASGSAFTFVNLDLAIGGSGSEVIFLPDHTFTAYNNQDIGPASISNLPINIPSGSRIAARAQGNGAGDPIGVNLYGIY